MGYALHIEKNEPISTEEWESAVLSIEGIKLDSAPIPGKDQGVKL